MARIVSKTVGRHQAGGDVGANQESFSQRTQPPHQAQPGAEFGGEEITAPSSFPQAPRPALYAARRRFGGGRLDANSWGVRRPRLRCGLI